MALKDRIAAVIRRLTPQSNRTTSDEMIAEPPHYKQVIERFEVGKTRREKVEDARRMYAEDPRVREVIKTLAEDATRGGFTVQVLEGPQQQQAQEVLDALMERIDLAKRATGWTRLNLRDGDGFLELGVDGEFLIQKITRKPTLSMYRNANRNDEFDDPRRAYWFSDSPFYERPGEDAIWFADWQMVHPRWDHDEGERYGNPLYVAARKPYRRVEQGELDIAVRRKTRSGMRYLHFIDTDDANEIEAYKQRNQAALNNKSAALADFFTNQKGAITPVQGDANLSEIEDVLHHIETLAIVSPLPLELLGYGRNLNRDVLAEKRKQYNDALPSLSEWGTDQILRPIFNRQLLLQSIWPGGLKYQVTWANKRTITAQMVLEAANAGLALKRLGIPMEIILDLLTQLIPGLDKETILAVMAKQETQEEPEPTPTPENPARQEEEARRLIESLGFLQEQIVDSHHQSNGNGAVVVR